MPHSFYFKKALVSKRSILRTTTTTTNILLQTLQRTPNKHLLRISNNNNSYHTNPTFDFASIRMLKQKPIQHFHRPSSFASNYNLSTRTPLLLKKNTPVFNTAFCQRSLATMTPNTDKIRLQGHQLDRLNEIITPELKRIEEIFKQHNFDIRLVGGVVRDIYLNQYPKDIDLATNANPHQMIEMLNKEGIRLIETGLQHGTITAVISKQSFEITSLRIDEETDGRHAVVQYTTNWKLDAERRDLTINAMNLDLDGYLQDYFNGRQHLEQRQIFFVGAPGPRIREDYLRILRFFRFHGRISESDCYDPDTLVAIEENRSGLTRISGERIWTEISKIIAGNRNVNIFKTMYLCGVCESIHLPDHNRLDTLEYVSTFTLEPISLLVSLLHDLSEFENICLTWKLANTEKNLGVFLLNHRQEFHDLLSQQESNNQVIFKYATDMLVDGVAINFLNELLLSHGQHSIVEQLKQYNLPRFPINGKDILSQGVPKGKAVGIAMLKLKTLWKESNYQLTAEELFNHL